MKILAGNSNRPLAEAIAAYLGEPLTGCHVRRFADLEIFVEILENVRGRDAFIIQSTSYPANDNLMELLIMIDALRRASAQRITAVLPYFGYARQDRKPGPRSPISAKLVANLITRAGADRVLTVDLHAGQIQGFFDIPTDNLFGAPTMVRDIQAHHNGSKNVMVVSPDVGGVVRARALAKRLDAPLAIVDKRRERAGESEVMNIIGDIAGRHCVLLDDIVDSGGTLVQRRRRAARGGRGERIGLYHPRRAFGRGGRARRRLEAQRTRAHRHDPADRSGPGRAQHPRDLDRAADRRGDRPHRQGRKRLVAVQLTAFGLTRGWRRTDRSHALSLPAPSSRLLRVNCPLSLTPCGLGGSTALDTQWPADLLIDWLVSWARGRGSRLAPNGGLDMFGRITVS